MANDAAANRRMDESRPNGDADAAVQAGDAGDGDDGRMAYHTACLIGYSLAFVIFGSQVSILGPTIKPLAARLEVDETDLSPLFTALGVSCIVSGTPSGWLVDRLPTHHVLVVSLLLEAVGFALVPLMPSVWSLTALYFLVCFTYNFTNSAVFTSLAWHYPKRAGGALNLVLAMFGVGSFFIPLAAQVCQSLLGNPLAVFWVVACIAVVAALPFLFLRSPVPPQLEKEVVDGDEDAPPEAAETKTMELITTVAVVMLVFFSTAAETAIGNWIFTYCSKEMNLDDSDSALANSLFWAAFTAGRVTGVVLSPFTTAGTLLLSYVPLSVIGASLPIVMQGKMTWHLVLATAILTGFGNSTGYANAIALLEQYVPVTGFINGIFGAVAGGACMVGPTLVAFLIRHSSFGYSSMAWVGLTFYILHFPAILTAITAGERALSQAVLAGEVDLEEPLLSPGMGDDSQQHPQEVHHDGEADTSHGGIRIRRSCDAPVPVPRSSIPGHGPMSLTRSSYVRSGSMTHGGLLSGSGPHGTSPALSPGMN